MPTWRTFLDGFGLIEGVMVAITVVIIIAANGGFRRARGKKE